MSNQVKLQYQSTRKKNPTSREILYDMKLIANHMGVYIKGGDVFEDYFWDCIQRVKQQNYYYAMRLEQLAYRHERARRKGAMRKAA